MLGSSMNSEDEQYLLECIEMSARSLTDDGYTPFGAVVVQHGQVLGRGYSTVIASHDPTGYAEVNALRAAGESVGTHLMPDATLYCNGEPCPMCLIACYWAGITRIPCAATVEDSARVGFEDQLYYSELKAYPNQTVRVEFANDRLRRSAADVLESWKDRHEVADRS